MPLVSAVQEVTIVVQGLISVAQIIGVKQNGGYALRKALALALDLVRVDVLLREILGGRGPGF